MAGDKKESKEIKKYKKLRQLAQNSKDFKQEAACCNALGNAYVKIEEFDKALEMHVEEKRLCDIIKDKIGYAVAHRMMGDVYLAKEDYERGMEELEKYLQLSSNFPVELQRANTQLGKSLYEYARSCLNDPQKSLLLVKSGIKHLTMSVTIAKELQVKRKVDEKESNEMQVRSYINLAISYHHLSIMDGSTTRYQPQIQQYFHKATTIAKKRYMFDELYLIYHLMASQSCDFNKCKVAVENCKVAIEYAKKCNNDEENLVDGFIFCGQMLLCLEDVENVKKYWKAAYNMMKSNQKCDFLPKLKTVFKISQLHESLKKKDDNLVCVYEKLGDLYCKLEAYRPAVTYYERLQALFGSNVKGEKKIEANNLYSLAQTYSDLRRYDEAIRYYLEEIKLREDYKEKSTSLLQVALCLEKQNCGDLSKITPYLQQALDYANEEKCDVTKVKVLQVKEEILRRFNRRNEANKVKIEVNYIEENLPLQQQDSEESVDDDDDDFDERLFNIQLSNINTSSITGVEVDGMKRSGRRRGGSSHIVEKKNAKGETPLHQACLTGQYNKVQQLIQMGHSVNTRDHFGWTPLHEVCNHGYADLVKLLLQHGAKVNVTAGDDIVTPMSDAAQNGHFQIVTMLYDAGADPTINNSKGRSTVDVLDGYYHHEQLQGDEKKAYHQTRTKLTGKGEVSQSQLLKVVPADDDDLLDSYRRPDDREDDVIIDDMKKSRRSASGGGGGSATKRSEKMRVTSSSTSFTHDVGDYDVTDDFLVDDSTPPRRKKARPSGDSVEKQRKISSQLFTPATVPATFPRRNSGGGKSTSGKKAGTNTQPAAAMTSSSSSWKRTTSPKWNDVVLVDDDVVDDDVGDVISWTSPTVMTSSTTVTSTQSPPPVQPPTPVSNKMKIKLKIDDMLFMVGVPSKTETIEWLNKCAVQRYEEATSIRVTITLTTEDHCLLSNHDVIGDVLSSGDVIIGQVKSRVVKALVESYREKCDELQIAKVEMIENCCKECDENKSMNLSNYSFQYQQHLKPLLQVIGLQSSVTEINLSGNRIGPEGIACLCESIMTSSSQRHKLPSLVKLNLKCCQLNSGSLLKLASCPYFHQLEKLDISHNRLNSEDGNELFQLLNNCEKIRHLNISDCDVNIREFIQLPNIQSIFINLPDLERFDVSDNDLNVDDVRRLLSLLRHNSKLKWINLNSTISSQYSLFIDILLEFLEERKELNLKYLNLKFNGLEAYHLDKIRSNENFMKISQLVL